MGRSERATLRWMSAEAADPDAALNCDSRSESDSAGDQEHHRGSPDPAAGLTGDTGRSTKAEPAPLWWQNHPQLSQRFTRHPAGDGGLGAGAGGQDGARSPSSDAPRAGIEVGQYEVTPTRVITPEANTVPIAPTRGAVHVGRGRGVHSALVTVPIGCWALSLIFDVVSRVSTVPAALVNDSTWLVGAGLASAVAAGIAGLAQAAPMREGSRAYRQVLVHGGLIMAVMVFYAFTLILRSADQSGPRAAISTVAMSAGGMLAVVVSAYAGRMVGHRRAGRQSRPSA